MRGFMYFQGISFPRLNRDRKDMEEIETEIEGNKDESEAVRIYRVIFFDTDTQTTGAYMQKTCDVAEKAILAKKKLRKKCVNRDKT